MFYPSADSDSTFLIGIAVLAAIVLVFMAIAIFVLLRDKNRLDKSATPLEASQSVPSDEITVASQPREREEDALPTVPPVEITVASQTEEKPTTQFEVSHRDMGRIQGISLTIALMFAFNLAVLYLIPISDPSGYVLQFILFIIATVLAVATGKQIAPLNWKETLAAVIIFVICLVAYFWIIAPILLAVGA